MKIHKLTFEHHLDTSIENAWKFFSSPHNLANITPGYMSFDITNGIQPNEPMHLGMIITYDVTPLYRIRLNWVTEITHCVDNDFFVDEQRFGPFKFWHHMHRFEQTADGILMKDTLHYSVGWGIIGRLINHLIVRDKIKSIFAYRKKRIDQLFDNIIK